MMHLRAHGPPQGSGKRGFTLVELMIVVVVVGVLAVVAYAGYHKFVVSSHLTEATNVLSGIKMRQEGYRAEKGTYLNVSKELDANGVTFAGLYPHCASSVQPGAFSVGWGKPCPPGCCINDWAKLHVETTAPTFYGFSSVADTSLATLAVNINNTPMTWPANPQGSWFVATAVGDPDGNQIFSTAMITSFDNEVRIDNDGE
jgi:prepilin-type N-terminal cleavage/methylation domain-containing protein